MEKYKSHTELPEYHTQTSKNPTCAFPPTSWLHLLSHLARSPFLLCHVLDASCYLQCLFLEFLSLPYVPSEPQCFHQITSLSIICVVPSLALHRQSGGLPPSSHLCTLARPDHTESHWQLGIGLLLPLVNELPETRKPLPCSKTPGTWYTK